MNRQLVLLICDTERYKPQVVGGRRSASSHIQRLWVNYCSWKTTRVYVHEKHLAFEMCNYASKATIACLNFLNWTKFRPKVLIFYFKTPVYQNPGSSSCISVVDPLYQSMHMPTSNNNQQLKYAI